MGQWLSICIDDNTNQCLCKVDIKPWLFLNKKGSKILDIYSSNIDVYWDLSSAKYGPGPEPMEGFYIAILSEQKLVLLIGDMDRAALKKTKANAFLSNGILMSKKEHIFSKNVFNSKTRFCNLRKLHVLTIECDTNSDKRMCLVVRVDTKSVMKVNHLKWNLRGNQTILVDGAEVDVFWDVYNWFFGGSRGSAVFVFKAKASEQKMWACKRFDESMSGDVGFSLVLFAWRSE